MSTYAIGDIQGCYESLQTLLAKIDFNPEQDILWFTGDLVNRGPSSLQTLRFVKQLRDRAITVLGNHDLHLLAVAEGQAREKPDDHLGDILKAEDKNELLTWLRHRPLMHDDPELGFSMVHAGLPPQWDHTQARQLANELESVLRSPGYVEFFKHMYGNKPKRWSAKLKGMERLRFITNCFTRIRYCQKDGSLCLKAKGPPGTQPAECMPWFSVKKRASADMNIIFGHWSALGLYREDGIFSLDSGCLWGQKLTAMRLQDQRFFSVQCQEYRKIG